MITLPFSNRLSMESAETWFQSRRVRYQRCYISPLLWEYYHRMAAYSSGLGELYLKEVCHFHLTFLAILLILFVISVPYAKTARILLAMSIPGQIIFSYVAHFIHTSDPSISIPFEVSYLLASTIQVSSWFIFFIFLWVIFVLITKPYIIQFSQSNFLNLLKFNYQSISKIHYHNFL